MSCTQIHALLGYTLGGVVGTFAAIWLTKILYGQ